MSSTTTFAVYRLMPAAEATRIAAEMQAQEDGGWTYRANIDPNGSGRAFVEIVDEDGVVVGRV